MKATWRKRFPKDLGKPEKHRHKAKFKMPYKRSRIDYTREWNR